MFNYLFGATMSKKNNPVTVKAVTVNPVTVPASIIEAVTVLCSLALSMFPVTFLKGTENVRFSINDKVFTFPVLSMFRYTVNALTPTLSLKTGTVYGVRRDAFLNFLCRLWNVTPRNSYKVTGKGNATLNTYGVIPSFSCMFPVDGSAYQFLALTALTCFDAGTWKFQNIKKHNLIVFCDADTFLKVHADGAVNVDVIPIDLPIIDTAFLNRFIDNVRRDEVERLTAEIFDGSFVDVLIK